jgi:cold shock CspA family protein
MLSQSAASSAESAPNSQHFRNRSNRRRGGSSGGGGEDASFSSKARHGTVAAAAPSCRITIYNGVLGFNSGAGKLLVVPESWDEFINLCSTKLGVSADRIRGIQMPPPDSASIDQIADMLNGDKIVVVVDQPSAFSEEGAVPLASRLPMKAFKGSAPAFTADSIDTESLASQELELMRIIESSPGKSFAGRVGITADANSKHAKALASFNNHGSDIGDGDVDRSIGTHSRTTSAVAIPSLVGRDPRALSRDLHSPTSSVPVIQPSASASTFPSSHLPPEGSLLWRVTKQPNPPDQPLSTFDPSSLMHLSQSVSDGAAIGPNVRYGMILSMPGVGGVGGHLRTHVCGHIEDIPFSRFDITASNQSVRAGDFVSFETQFRSGTTGELAVHAVNILLLPGNYHEMIAAFGGGVGSADGGPLLLQQQQQQQHPQSNMANKKSRQQAHFSVLVRVLRDNLVQSGSKDMLLENLVSTLAEVYPDWKTRLECQNLYQYVAEAHACGLVECIESSDSNCIVRLNGERSLGVVKWVKDSYGFIQSPFHTEDLFYHASEHCSDLGVTMPLASGQEVEFLIVKNALTGKLNATQIHLLVRSDPRLAELRINILKENLPRGQSQPGLHPASAAVFPVSMMPQAAGTKMPFRASAFSVSGLPSKSQQSNVSGVIADNEPNKEPGLHKTKLCKFYPYCPRGAHCWFAHGPHELRMHVDAPCATESVSENLSLHAGDEDFQSQSFGSSGLFHIGSDYPSIAPVSSWSSAPRVSGAAFVGNPSSAPYQQHASLSNHVSAHYASVGSKGAGVSNVSQDSSPPQVGSVRWGAE